MTSENKRKSVKMASIAASAFLLVMFISGALFFFIRGNNDKTSSTIATPTLQRATPTLPAPTPSVSSTPQPLFFDDFTDASKGWSLSSASGYMRTLSNNTLTLSATNHKLLTESLPTSTTFSDFRITVTFTLVQASQSDSVGLYLRGDSFLDHDYRIDIYGNNTYAISKEYLDANKYPQVQFLVSPVSTHRLKPVGQQNTVTAEMKGPLLVLFINGILTNSVTDPDYTSGQIALFVQNSDTSGGVEASFSSIEVYSVPEQPPSK